MQAICLLPSGRYRGDRGISDTNAPDFIIGHHVYVTKDGIEQFHRANDFDDTWRMMRKEHIPING